MKHADVEKHLGDFCTLNGYGDLMMDGEVKEYIKAPCDLEYPLQIVKLTKGGLVHVAYYTPDRHHEFSVPAKNVDLVGMWLDGEEMRYSYLDARMNPEYRKVAINRLMTEMPDEWKYYWCDAMNTELGCNCMGCVNGSGQLLNKHFTKDDWREWVREHPPAADFPENFISLLNDDLRVDVGEDDG